MEDEISQVLELQKEIEEFVGENDAETLAKRLKEDVDKKELREFLVDIYYKIEDIILDGMDGSFRCTCAEKVVFRTTEPGNWGLNVYQYCLNCGGYIEETY